MLTVLLEKRCSNCNKVLAKAALKDATLEIACPKCKTVNTYQIEPNQKESEGQVFTINPVKG